MSKLRQLLVLSNAAFLLLFSMTALSAQDTSDEDATIGSPTVPADRPLESDPLKGNTSPDDVARDPRETTTGTPTLPSDATRPPKAKPTVEASSEESHLQEHLGQQLLGLEVKLHELMQHFGSQHPSVLALKERQKAIQQVRRAHQARQQLEAAAGAEAAAEETDDTADPRTGEDAAAVIPRGKRVISINVDPAIEKLVKPGDHIDIYSIWRTRDEEHGQRQVVELIAENVVVFSVSGRQEARAANESASIGLVVDPTQAKQILLGETRGLIRVAFRADGDREVAEYAEVEKELNAYQQDVEAMKEAIREREALEEFRALERADQEAVRRDQMLWQRELANREVVRARRAEAQVRLEHELQVRIERLAQAHESLKAAGLHEMADDVAQQIDALRAEHMANREEHHHDHGVRDELRDLRREVRALRQSINELHELLDRQASLPQEPGRAKRFPSDDAEAGGSALEDTAEDDFQLVTTGLVVYEAPWCGPCQKLVPILQKLAKSGVEVQRINISQHPEKTRSANVTAIPTIDVVHEGKQVARVTGLTSETRLRDLMRSFAKKPDGGVIEFEGRGATENEPATSFEVELDVEGIGSKIRSLPVRLKLAEPGPREEILAPKLRP